MGIGRILYLTFGSLMLIFALMWAFDDDEPANMQRAHVFALGSIGLMVAGAACGAAERKNTYLPPAVPRPPAPPLPAQHLPAQHLPAPQPYPQQGHDPRQGHAAPQPYDPRQGYTLPYPPGQNH